MLVLGPLQPRTPLKIEVGLQASVKVKATQDNVAGVRLPKFESFKEGVDTKLGLIGLGTGGKQIQECR